MIINKRFQFKFQFNIKIKKKIDYLKKVVYKANIMDNQANYFQ
jgi:hypothetical protein